MSKIDALFEAALFAGASLRVRATVQLPLEISPCFGGLRPAHPLARERRAELPERSAPLAVERVMEAVRMTAHAALTALRHASIISWSSNAVSQEVTR